MTQCGALTLAFGCLVWAATFPEGAGAESNPYALDRLFLESSDATPLDEVLSFDSETAVANYYGASSIEAKVATEFFAGYTGDSANMLFARYPVLPARAHLYGSNISDLTLAQLQAINGSLSITSEGYNYSGTVNLSGVKSFSGAALAIEDALNKSLPPAADTTGSSIEPVSVPFTGSISANVLDVTSLPSGSIEIGSMITVPGFRTRDQVSAQLSGTPGGIGTYALFLHGRSPGQSHVPPETLTETYGVLTVGSVSSGSVAVGDQVTNGHRGSADNVLPHTAIEANLSGSGAGSTWVVDLAQSVTSEDMTMTGAPINVRYDKVTGANENSGFFLLQQWSTFNYTTSSLTYMGGTAAKALGLTQGSGAFVSPTGEIVTDPSAWMNNFIQAPWGTDQFDSFQVQFDQRGRIPPGERQALAEWAESTDGEFKFLWSAVSTPPIVNMMDPGMERDPVIVEGAIPEPSTWAMLLLGLAGLGIAGNSRKVWAKLHLN
jgi:hypothetical protein